MVSEVRFRDILAHESNSDLLKKKIEEITDKDLEWNLISKELPLHFDVVGLQLRHCDIVGFDEENNIYIIELKKKINDKNIKSTIKQVNDYVNLFEDIVSYIKNNNPLFYYHLVLLRYFEYVNFDYHKINEIIPIIISIEEFDDDFKVPKTANCSFINNKTLNLLLNNFISRKTQHFIDTYKKKLNIDTSFLFNNALKKENIDNKSWFPLVLSKTNFKSDNSSLSYKYQIVFENVHDYKRIHFNITEEYESLLNSQYKKETLGLNSFILEKFSNIHLVFPEELRNKLNEYSNIPAVYYRLNYLETFKKIEKFFQNAKSQGKPLRFNIQLFRSGRTNPIIYLQLFEDVYIPLIQIKPVVVSIDPTVNTVITYDFKNNIKEDKTCFYEDVILFDSGTYEINLEEDHGVNFYNITLKGEKNNYDFRAYSPKLRGVKELLPYMTPKKVQNELNEIIELKGINYLFKSNEEGDNEWIVSKLNIKNYEEKVQ